MAYNVSITVIDKDGTTASGTGTLPTTTSSQINIDVDVSSLAEGGLLVRVSCNGTGVIEYYCFVYTGLEDTVRPSAEGVNVYFSSVGDERVPISHYIYKFTDAETLRMSVYGHV